MYYILSIQEVKDGEVITLFQPSFLISQAKKPLEFDFSKAFLGYRQYVGSSVWNALQVSL